MCSEKDIKEIFLKIRNDSFEDCSSSGIHIKTMGFSGYSSPFTGDVYINLEAINNTPYSKAAIVGLITHELGHQVSYHKRSFFGKVLFLWNYYLSIKKRRVVEDEADKIAIERGYGKELIVEIKAGYKRHAKNKKLLAFLKKAYMTPEEIQLLLKKHS